MSFLPQIKGQKREHNWFKHRSGRRLKTAVLNGRKVFTFAFWAGIVCILFFVFQAWIRTGFLNEKVNGYEAEAKEQMNELQQSGFADSPAGEAFTRSFVSDYLTVPADSKGRKARKEKLQGYLAEGLKIDDLEDLSAFKGKRVLKSASLYDVKNVRRAAASYVYRVEYELFKTEEKKMPAEVKKRTDGKTETVKEEKTIQTDVSKGVKDVLIAVPVKTDGSTFNVSEQPYFQAIPGKSRMKAVEDETDPSRKNAEAETFLKTFTTQFFTSYTSNTLNEMGYLMEKPEVLKGYTYQGLDTFTVYNGRKEGEYLIKTLVLLTEEDTGLATKQPFTLTVDKRNHHYYVESLTHTIGG